MKILSTALTMATIAFTFSIVTTQDTFAAEKGNPAAVYCMTLDGKYDNNSGNCIFNVCTLTKGDYDLQTGSCTVGAWALFHALHKK